MAPAGEASYSCGGLVRCLPKRECADVCVPAEELDSHCPVIASNGSTFKRPGQQLESSILVRTS